MGITVPQRPDPQVQETAARVVPTTTQAPAAAFGGGVEQVAQATQQIGRLVTSRADQELDRANKLWFVDTENKIMTKQLELETRVKNVKGRNAFGLHNEIEKEFKDFISEIEQTAIGSIQKDGLSSIATSRGGSLNRFVTGHVNNQIESAEKTGAAAYRSNLINSAMIHYSDATQFEIDRHLFQAQLKDDIEREGMDKSTAKAYKLENTSRFHLAVASQMMDNGDEAFVSEYVNEFADEISELDKQKLRPAIEEAVLRSNSRTMTDDIIAKEEDWGKRFDLAKKIRDDKLSDEVTRRLKSELGLQRSIESQENSDSYMAAKEEVDGTKVHPRDILGAKRWIDLSDSQQASLIRRSGVNEQPMDFKVFRKFNALGIKELAALTEGELDERYLSSFSPEFDSQAIKAWTSAQKAVDTGSFIKSEVTPVEAADSFLKDVEFLPESGTFGRRDKDGLEKYRIFHEIFNRRVTGFQKEPDNPNGALPNEVESKIIANEVWEETLRVDGENKKFAEATAEEIKGRRTPFAKPGVRGLAAEDVAETENTLRGLGVTKPTDLDKRAAERDNNELDNLYSRMIQSYSNAIDEKDTFRAIQLLRQYNKDLKELSK